jgi:hypothetical protein
MTLLPASPILLALRLALAAGFVGAWDLQERDREVPPVAAAIAAPGSDEASCVDRHVDPRPLSNLSHSPSGMSFGLPERAPGKLVAMTARQKNVAPRYAICRGPGEAAGHRHCSRPVRVLYCIWTV